MNTAVEGAQGPALEQSGVADVAAATTNEAPSLPGAPESVEPKQFVSTVHTWTPKVKQTKNYDRHKAYLAQVDPDILHRFIHLRPLKGQLVHQGRVKNIYNLYGGATVVIEIDYKAQVVRAGLSLVHVGGIDKVSGKAIKPDNYSRATGRFEAVERIMDRNLILQRPDQLKYTYLELPLDFFQDAIGDIIGEIETEVAQVIRSYGLFVEMKLDDLAQNLSLQQVSNEVIQVGVLDEFARHFKQLKNYF